MKLVTCSLRTTHARAVHYTGVAGTECDCTYKQDSWLLQVHAQLLPQLPLGGKLLTERWSDWQAVHSDLVLTYAHGESPLLGLLCGHKAAVHIFVKPGVVAGGEVCHDSGKLDGPLDACPAGRQRCGWAGGDAKGCMHKV